MAILPPAPETCEHAPDSDAQAVGQGRLAPQARRGARLRRRYVGEPGRQFHLLEGGEDRGQRPLYCLHATAYAGRSFTPFLQAIASMRRVVAIDAPGYGASDPPAGLMDIAGYARAIDTALDAAGEGEVDLFGYHTGAVIAAELARQRPDRIGRVVLIGVPYFTGAEQAEWRTRLAERVRLGEDLDQFAERWDYLVTLRPAGVALTRGFENFVDELRAWPRGWWAHDAAFTFDVAACFGAVSQPVLVLNPASHLSVASRRAAEALPGGQLVELPHLASGIFDLAPDELAVAMDAFLRGPRSPGG